MEEELHRIILLSAEEEGDCRRRVGSNTLLSHLVGWFSRYFFNERSISVVALPILRTALLAVLQCKEDNQDIPKPLVDWIRETLLPALFGRVGEHEEALSRLIVQILK